MARCFDIIPQKERILAILKHVFEQRCTVLYIVKCAYIEILYV